MIGNDVVDLELASSESNWRRPNYLCKIFSVNEQQLIHSAADADLAVWILWSKKESAYKIYNRLTKLRGFIPLQIECESTESNCKVRVYGDVYYTKTEINAGYVHTIAANSEKLLAEIYTVDGNLMVIKKNGLPYVTNDAEELLPASISHHGKYNFTIAAPHD